MATIKTSSGNTISVVKASKELIVSLLEGNVHNRKINRRRVEIIKKDLREGNWKFNGATIVIDSNGRLLDGQHRCVAIQEEGYPPVELVVVYLNDGNDAMQYIDCGKSRSYADVFKMKGHDYSVQVAGITTGMIHLLRGTSDLVSRSYVMEFYEKNKSLIEKFVMLYKSDKNIRDTFRCAAISVAALISEAYGKENKVIDFIKCVAGGEGLHKGTAEYAVQRFSINVRTHQMYNSGDGRLDYANIIGDGIIKGIKGEKCDFVRKGADVMVDIRKRFGFIK